MNCKLAKFISRKNWAENFLQAEKNLSSDTFCSTTHSFIDDLLMVLGYREWAFVMPLCYYIGNKALGWQERSET